MMKRANISEWELLEWIKTIGGKISNKLKAGEFAVIASRRRRLLLSLDGWHWLFWNDPSSFRFPRGGWFLLRILRLHSKYPPRMSAPPPFCPFFLFGLSARDHCRADATKDWMEEGRISTQDCTDFGWIWGGKWRKIVTRQMRFLERDMRGWRAPRLWNGWWGNVWRMMKGNITKEEWICIEIEKDGPKVDCADPGRRYSTLDEREFSISGKRIFLEDAGSRHAQMRNS